jgi:hypothetical protein
VCLPGFQAAHFLCGTALNRLRQPVAGYIDTQEFSHLSQRGGGVCNHVFVAQQEKAGPLISCAQPACHILSPGTVGTGMAGNKTLNEGVDWGIIADKAPLALKVILGNRHIARIADDVDYPGIAGIKVLVAFQQTGSRQAIEGSLAQSLRVRNDAIDCGEVDGFLGVYEVRNQKARPGIS